MSRIYLRLLQERCWQAKQAVHLQVAMAPEGAVPGSLPARGLYGQGKLLLSQKNRLTSGEPTEGTRQMV
jgi:hypothetical protein